MTTRDKLLCCLYLRALMMLDDNSLNEEMTETAKAVSNMIQEEIADNNLLNALLKTDRLLEKMIIFLAKLLRVMNESDKTFLETKGN